MKYLIFIIVMLKIQTLWMFYQSGYEIDNEFGKLVYINESFLYNCKFFNHRINRTATAFNVFCCTKVKLGGNQLKFNTKFYGISNNAPKATVINFDLPTCDLLDKNIFGSQVIMKTGNFTKCPIEKGCYAADNVIIDSTQLPPLIPEGKYQVDFTHFLYDSKFLLWRLYITLRRKNPWEE